MGGFLGTGSLLSPTLVGCEEGAFPPRMSHGVGEGSWLLWEEAQQGWGDAAVLHPPG